MSVKEPTPEHVQKVRKMSEEELLAECNSILALKPIEPKRELPDHFKDGKIK